MTHVMVPDGVFPWWLSAAGWILAVALLALATRRLRDVPPARMVPLVGVTTALMVVIMSLELVPIGYELHFTVLTGMIIGPWFGAIAALIFNLLRALIGDGAFTNIGLNTVITWIEIALGAAFWAALRPLAQRRAAVAAGGTTFASLLVATLVFIGVVGISTIDPAEAIHTGAYDVQAGGFKEAPLSEGLLSVRVAEGHEADEASAAERIGFVRFALAMLVLGLIGWTIEALLVGAIVAFIARVRPELLGLRSAPA
jgi:ABC-type Co2+ transport system permease subunit